MKTFKLYVIALLLGLLCSIPTFASEIKSTEIETSLSVETKEELDRDPDVEIIGESREDGLVLIWNKDGKKIFYDAEHDIYEDANGVVDKEELYELGILSRTFEETEPLVEPKEITLNLKVEFLNLDVSKTDINNVMVSVVGEPRYEGEDEYEPEFIKINLSKENNYMVKQNFICSDQTFSLKPIIPIDYSNAYEIHVKYNQDETYFFSSEIPVYDITIVVSKPDYTILDSNKTPTLSDDWSYLASGKYSESRAEELDIEFSDSPKENTKAVKDRSANYIIILFLIIGLIIIIIIGSIYYIYKKVNKDDK